MSKTNQTINVDQLEWIQIDDHTFAMNFPTGVLIDRSMTSLNTLQGNAMTNALQFIEGINVNPKESVKSEVRYNGPYSDMRGLAG